MTDEPKATLRPGLQPAQVDLVDVPDSVLVIGGTGMLAPAVHALLAAGRRVVLVSRRAAQFAATVATASPGRLVTITADLADPGQIGDEIAATTEVVTIGAAVLWVHRPFRDAVIAAVDGALPAGAYLVRLWGSGSGDPRADAAVGPHPRGREAREVYLGSVTGQSGRRWLTHDEISVGALVALGTAGPAFSVGRLPG